MSRLRSLSFLLSLPLVVAACGKPSDAEIRAQVAGQLRACLETTAEAVHRPEAQDALQALANVVQQWRRERPAGDVTEALRLGDPERDRRLARVVADELEALAERIFDPANVVDEGGDWRRYRTSATVLCDVDVGAITEAAGERTDFDRARCLRDTEEHAIVAEARAKGDGFEMSFFVDDRETPLFVLFVEDGHLAVSGDVGAGWQWLKDRGERAPRWVRRLVRRYDVPEGSMRLDVRCRPSRDEVEFQLSVVDGEFRVHRLRRVWNDYDEEWDDELAESLAVSPAEDIVTATLGSRGGRLTFDVPEVTWWNEQAGRRKLRRVDVYGLSASARTSAREVRLTSLRFERVELFVGSERYAAISTTDGSSARFLTNQPMVAFDRDVQWQLQFDNSLRDWVPPALRETSYTLTVEAGTALRRAWNWDYQERYLRLLGGTVRIEGEGAVAEVVSPQCLWINESRRSRRIDEVVVGADCDL